MCVVDEIFIEVPSFQETSPAFEKFLESPAEPILYGFTSNQYSQVH